jgi:hypothetical protein
MRTSSRLRQPSPAAPATVVVVGDVLGIREAGEIRIQRQSEHADEREVAEVLVDPDERTARPREPTASVVMRTIAS